MLNHIIGQHTFIFSSVENRLTNRENKIGIDKPESSITFKHVEISEIISGPS